MDVRKALASSRGLGPPPGTNLQEEDSTVLSSASSVDTPSQPSSPSTTSSSISSSSGDESAVEEIAFRMKSDEDETSDRDVPTVAFHTSAGIVPHLAPFHGRRRRHLRQKKHGFFGGLRETIAEAFPPVSGRVLGYEPDHISEGSGMSPSVEILSRTSSAASASSEVSAKTGFSRFSRTSRASLHLRTSRRVVSGSQSGDTPDSTIPQQGRRVKQFSQSFLKSRDSGSREQGATPLDSSRKRHHIGSDVSSLLESQAIDMSLHGVELFEKHQEVLHHEVEMEDEVSRKLQFAMSHAPSHHLADLAGSLPDDVAPRRHMTVVSAFDMHVKEVHKLFNTLKTTGVVMLDIPGWDAEEFADQILDELVLQNFVSRECREIAFASIETAETHFPRAIGNAYDILFGTVPNLENGAGISVSFARLKRPVNMDAPDAMPTRFVFLMLVSGEHSTVHTVQDICEGINFLMCEDEFHDDAVVVETKTGFFKAVQNFLQRMERAGVDEIHHFGEHIPDYEAAEALAARRTGTLGLGLWLDLKGRISYFTSDMRDASNKKSLMASMYLYFSCLAPALAFGSIMSPLTADSIGVTEMMLSTSFVMSGYALFSAQPLTVLGGTGPMVVYTGVLYDVCLKLGLAFLPVYAWVGVWTSLFCLIIGITEASILIRYCTRFTDEIHALLIEVMFIAESLSYIFSLILEARSSDHASRSGKLAGAFLAVIIFSGVTYVAEMLRDMRRSPYLHQRIRAFLADFGAVISIASMTMLNFWIESAGVTTDRLLVPDAFEPTLCVEGPQADAMQSATASATKPDVRLLAPLACETKRRWFVHMDELSPGIILACSVPALMATALLFLDHNVTQRLINRADNKLRKPGGYHWDFSVMGSMIGVCSVFGLPWLVASTVRSVNHLHAVSTMEQWIDKSGRQHERIVRVREQRITGIIAGVLIGLSLFAEPWLDIIPISVLRGLIFVMGVGSLAHSQFFERVKLLFTQPSLFPPTHYARRVPPLTIHTYTVVQLLCLGLLLGFKLLKPVALFFPILILLFIPLRLKVLPLLFSEGHLEVLDADEEPDENEVEGRDVL